MKQLLKDFLDRHPLLYRAILFYKFHGRVPNLIRPKLLNDKIAWRILFDRRNFLVWACDKLEMKTQAQLRCPEVLIPETLAVFTNLAKIRNFDLTGHWVLKEISGSGQVHFGHENPNSDTYAEIATLLESWEIKTKNRRQREFGYKNAGKGYLIERRISTDELADYKFHTFDGMVQFVSFHNGRKESLRHAVYSPDGELLPVRWGPPLPEVIDPLPDNFQTMRKYAEMLGQGIDYVRIDFYSHAGEIYFGEFTPYVGAGLAKIEPREYELKMGAYWKLPTFKEARAKTSR